MNPEQKEIKLSYATLIYEQPIVQIIFTEAIELGFPETRQLISAAEELSGKRPYVVLADVRPGIDVTREGRKVAANSEESPFHKGTAVLVNSSMLTLDINFFSGIIAPSFPYRAFTKKEEATKWLLSLQLGQNSTKF